jgi:hypothetical protein
VNILSISHVRMNHEKAALGCLTFLAALHSLSLNLSVSLFLLCVCVSFQPLGKSYFESYNNKCVKIKKKQFLARIYVLIARDNWLSVSASNSQNSQLFPSLDELYFNFFLSFITSEAAILALFLFVFLSRIVILERKIQE